MNSINHVAWSQTVPAAGSKAATENSAAAAFSATLETMKKGAGEKDNDDGSKTIIERSTVTASDGSQMLVLTQVTVSADGKRSAPKVIAKYKIASPEKTMQKAPAAKENMTAAQEQTPSAATLPNQPLKNTIGREYENNSVTGGGAAGNLLSESI